MIKFEFEKCPYCREDLIVVRNPEAHKWQIACRCGASGPIRGNLYRAKEAWNRVARKASLK